MAVTLKDLVIFGSTSLFERIVPLDDDRLREELPRAFLRYLGVKE